MGAKIPWIDIPSGFDNSLFQSIFYLRRSISQSMKKTLIFLFLLFAAFANAQTYSGPESVEYDYAGRRWLIANTSSHQVLSRDSAGTLSIFVSGLSSGPYGIEIVGDTLFCCAGNSIKGYLLANGSPVFSVNVGASFLNGMTHDNDGNLIATDFSAKKIFKVNIAAQTFSAIASGLATTPNGIVFDAANNRCVFVNWGSNAPVSAIDMNTNAVSTLIPTTLASCDGITRDASGNYFISAWGSQSVVRFDSAFATPPVTVASNLSSPADIFYNTLGDTLAIPNSGNNTVTFVAFPSTTGLVPLTDNLHMNLFPNPALSGGFAHLHIFGNSNAEAELFTMQGAVLSGRITKESNISSDSEFLIDCRDIIPGMYFLKITFGQKSLTKSLLID